MKSELFDCYIDATVVETNGCSDERCHEYIQIEYSDAHMFPEITMKGCPYCEAVVSMEITSEYGINTLIGALEACKKEMARRRYEKENKDMQEAFDLKKGEGDA